MTTFWNKKMLYKKIILSGSKALANFTLAKFCGATITVTILAMVKYLISGNFHLEYSDFFMNISIGLLGWTINTGIITWLTEHLGIKGININLYEILYGISGCKKIPFKLGETNIDSSSKPSAFKLEDGSDGKPKLYNAMDSGEGSSSDKKSNSSKGGYRDKERDIRFHPYPRNGRRAVRSWVFDYESDNESENGSNSGSDTEMEDGPSNRNKAKKEALLANKSLDKGKAKLVLPSDFLDKGIVPTGLVPSEGGLVKPTTGLDKGKGIELANTAIEPPFALWSKLFPGQDPLKVFFPPKINPGPGFDVPGGEVPIHDDICKHIDYNSHVLSQFKNMDYELAKQQRDRYLYLIQVMNGKIGYAQEVNSKIPTIPTTDYEFRLRNQIMRDIDGLSIVRAGAEGKATLLTSRIRFIEAQLNKKD